jgi:hypothetical protein
MQMQISLSLVDKINSTMEASMIVTSYVTVNSDINIAVLQPSVHMHWLHILMCSMWSNAIKPIS